MPAAAVMKAGAFSPVHAAPEFALQGSDGSEVTLARYRGKVVLLTFGFTHCAAVCPTTLATLAQARSALGKAADGVQVIYVTVDPERDDAAHMQQYLAAFDRSFIGATGEPDTLAAVRERYGVTAVKEGDGPDYAVAHTSSIFLIDRAGQLRAVMPFGHDAADFVHDVALLG
jgi:protein SCO1/2